MAQWHIVILIAAAVTWCALVGVGAAWLDNADREMREAAEDKEV